MGGVFALGLLLLSLVLGAEAADAWWTYPGMALGAVMTLGSMTIIAFDLRPRGRNHP